MVEQWWRDAVVYEVYVRSFADSDGDGVGDLEGIRAHLPHLVALGVDAVWLTPFYPSPRPTTATTSPTTATSSRCSATSRPSTGCSPRRTGTGCGLIVDIVPNHTSSAHPWFQEALADPASPAAGPLRVPRRQRARRPSRRTTGRASSADRPGPASRRTAQWYLHLFDSSQPDLDWAQPRAVHEEFLRILRFWLDRGVDGFRIDVAHSLYKQPDLADDPRADIEAGLLDERPPDPHLGPGRGARRSTRSGARCSTPTTGDRMMVGEVFLFDVAAGRPVRRRHPAAPGVQLHRLQGRRGRRKGLRRVARARARGASTRPPGCCPTTTSPGTSPATAAATWAGGAGWPSRRCCSPCRARPTSTRARSSGSTRATCPPTAARTRCSCATDGRRPAATAAARRCRGPPTRPASASPPASRGCRSARTRRRWPWTVQAGRPGLDAVAPTAGCWPAGASCSPTDCRRRRRVARPGADVLALPARAAGGGAQHRRRAGARCRVPAGTLLEATADGAAVSGGVLTVPAAATVWLRT